MSAAIDHSPESRELGLALLLEPLSPQAFLEGEWPGSYLYNPGSLERFDQLRSVEALRDVDSVIEAFWARGDLVQTWFSDEDIRHTHWGRIDEARHHYDHGARLQLNQAENAIPELHELIGRLERDLGLPLGTASTTIIASPPGARAYPHFDSYPQFTVQLQGRKRWTMGPQLCPCSLHSHVLGDDDTRMRQFYDEPLPTVMPPDTVELEVTPGDVLYVPSGLAHAVESVDHAISIAFDLVVPRWTNLVTKRITDALERALPWRSFALGLGPTATASQRERAERTARELLADLRHRLARIVDDPQGLLDVAPTGLLPAASRRLELTPGVMAELSPPSGEAVGEGWRIRVEHPEQGASEIEVTESLVPLCRWLLDRRGPFSDVEALHSSRGALQANVRELLVALLETGALRVVGAEP